MALNMLIYDDNRCFEDILKLYLDILKLKIYLRWDQYNFFSCLEGDRTTKLTGTFLSEKGMTFCGYNFFKSWNESGKVGFNTGCY